MNHSDMAAETLAALDRLRPMLVAAPRSRLELALDLANDWRMSATGSGSTGKPSGVSNPTMRTALNNLEYGRSEESQAYQLITSRIEQIIDGMRDLNRLTERCQQISGSQAHKLFLSETGTEANRAIPCACLHCDDPATSGDPHCAPCRVWLKVHPDVRQVPRTVIESRLSSRKNREQTRVHVTGPLAEQEAS